MPLISNVPTMLASMEYSHRLINGLIPLPAFATKVISTNRKY
jgi:hypothetical protein